MKEERGNMAAIIITLVPMISIFVSIVWMCLETRKSTKSTYELVDLSSAILKNTAEALEEMDKLDMRVSALEAITRCQNNYHGGDC